MSTLELQNALQARFSAPEHALFFEVASSTGGGGRYADAIAMNLWKSRGLKISGFELKADRRDWLRELKNPAKAEAIARMCNEWWLVTTENVVKDADEIPDPWGWLQLQGKKVKSLRVKKKPEVRPSLSLDGVDVLPRHFAAAIIRRAHEFSQRRTELNLERKRAYEDGLKDGRSGNKLADEKRVLESQIRALKMELENHEKALKEAGLGGYNSWSMPRIARHVKLLHQIDPKHIEAAFKTALGGLDRTRKNLKDALEEFSKEIDGE